VCEHIWTDANFQTPQTCIECGETEGNAVISYFTEHGFTPNASVGNTYDYKTVTFSRHLETIGTVNYVSLEIIESDELREAREGYEWLVLNTRVNFSDPNYQSDGYRTWFMFTDYYTGALIFPDEFIETFPINFNGEEYEGRYFINRFPNEVVGNTSDTIVRELSLSVPIGYDGIVQVQFNSANLNLPDSFDDVAARAETASDFICEDSVILRLRG
jgi:hypothetical protein